MTKALSRDGKGLYSITEKYGPSGAPRSFCRNGKSHWIENKNTDGTVSRTYCDAVSWAQNLDIYEKGYRFPSIYTLADGVTISDGADDPWTDMLPAAPHPFKLVVTAAILTAVIVVFSPLIVACMVLLRVFDAFTDGEPRDFGIAPLFRDLGSLWRGQLPEDF